MKTMSWLEFSQSYCERQDSTPERLKEILLRQKHTYKPIGWVLLQCLLMNSSKMGQLTILPYGPNNSLKEPPTHPISPRGLASDMSVVIGLLPSSEIE